jgi:hypothetical protein
MELLKDGRESRALAHILEFTKKVEKLISEINVEQLMEGGLNPYLIAALNIRDFEEIAELFVYKRVERSLGTSFGNVIEAFLAELLGGRSGKEDPRCKRGSKLKHWICWWDIVIEREVERGGKKYRGVVLSIKSGPADVNKDIVSEFIRHAKEAEAAGYKPYLVLTYGKRAFEVAVSTLKTEGLDPRDYLLVGRELFGEFLGDPNYYERVIDAIREVSAGVEVGVFDRIEKKIKEIAEELKKRYGNDLSKFLKDLS